MTDNMGWDRVEVAPEAPLCGKADAKIRFGQMSDDARDNAARDINPSPGTERKRKVARDTAEKGTEHVEGRAAGGAGALERGCGDLSGIAPRCRNAVDGGDSVV